MSATFNILRCKGVTSGFGVNEQVLFREYPDREAKLAVIDDLQLNHETKKWEYDISGVYELWTKDKVLQDSLMADNRVVAEWERPIFMSGTPCLVRKEGSQEFQDAVVLNGCWMPYERKWKYYMRTTFVGHSPTGKGLIKCGEHIEAREDQMRTKGF